LTALAACLVFLESNSLLPDVKLPVDAWEEFVLQVAASKLDRDATTRRLRKLVKSPRKR
jgi:prophage maintenance system killer protein